MDGEVDTVAGVLPASFQFPRSDASYFSEEPDLIFPVANNIADSWGRNSTQWFSFGRLKAGMPMRLGRRGTADHNHADDGRRPAVARYVCPSRGAEFGNYRERSGGAAADARHFGGVVAHRLHQHHESSIFAGRRSWTGNSRSQSGGRRPMATGAADAHRERVSHVLRRSGGNRAGRAGALDALVATLAAHLADLRAVSRSIGWCWVCLPGLRRDGDSRRDCCRRVHRSGQTDTLIATTEIVGQPRRILRFSASFDGGPDCVGRRSVGCRGTAGAQFVSSLSSINPGFRTQGTLAFELAFPERPSRRGAARCTSAFWTPPAVYPA